MKTPTLKHENRPDSLRRQKHPHHRSFKVVMRETTYDMPSHRRAFSVFIHNKTISAVSDLLGKTIFRPNAILFGAILSFSVTLSIYLLSKNFGYSLSGFESIGSFLVGWIAGQLFDLISSLIRKKQL